MDKKHIISYWIKSSDNDFRAMVHLFETKDYSWSLFVGHLVVEKLLKAYYVKNIAIQPPFIHNLLRLAEKSELRLNEEQENFLDTVSTFNIRARYDDYKMDFHKTCSKKFSEIWINEIKKFRKWIKKIL